MVACGGPRDCLHAAPRRAIRGEKLCFRRIHVLIVTGGQHRVEGSAYQQVGRGELLAAPILSDAAVEVGVHRVTGDVTGDGDHRIGRSDSRVTRPVDREG